MKVAMEEWGTQIVCDIINIIITRQQWLLQKSNVKCNAQCITTLKMAPCIKWIRLVYLPNKYQSLIRTHQQT